MPILDTTKDLAALFVAQAKSTPDAIALEDETRSLTYAELDRETENMADYLRLHHRVGRDSLVGILMNRSADYVVASLAALRAGGAFLVLELAYPSALLRDVIDDAKPSVVLTQMAHVEHIKSDVAVVAVDQTGGYAKANGLSNGSELPIPSDNDLDRLAFVSYSSGTTGQPKGIANPHRAAVLSYDLRFQLSDLSPKDRVACNVFFVWEMLRPLVRGATVIAIPDRASYDPTALVSILASKRVTDTLMTPTLLSTVLSRYPNLRQELPDLKSLWLNGEVVTAELCRRGIKALPNTRLLNVYSASETHEVAAGDIRQFLDSEMRVCPVGPLMDPEHIYILDESGNRVGNNISGELYVGGDLLARGYINLPETTAKVFTPDPFSKKDGARMYKTGDLARILPSGLLEITGRAGGMIKTRGYTVQPGAVETAIVKHLAVHDCAVTAFGDGLERQLVAYVVRDREDSRDREELDIDESGYSPAARRALSSHLALYMIPAIWVEMDVLPTHGVSGKIDLKALPAPPSPKTKLNGVEKDSNTEVKIETVKQLWADVLNMPPSAIKDDHGFFDIGGHSLVLAILASRLSKEFGFPVPLAPLAGNPTLSGHMEAIRDARDGHTAAVQADLPAVLRTDIELDEDIKSNGSPMRQLSEASTVLLTGATGYLGAFLLKTLIENTTATIICLVRFTDPDDDCRPAGFARIRKNLVDLGLWDDGMLERMEVLPGNLSGKRLGLSTDSFNEVASRIEVIIHAAATVNLVYPYAALRSANVGGTREILRLASMSGATLHHISTNGVLVPSVEGWSEDAMVELEDVPEKLLDGYGQTKWVAEMLVCEASRRGMPVKIYRPGTISGHSTTGSTNTYDLLNALIVESLQLGCAPSIEQWFTEMTPADFVTDAIIALADHTESDQLVYHLGDSNPISASSLFDSLNELGYNTTRLPWADWVCLWNEKRGNGKNRDEPFTVDILRGGMPTVEGLQSVTVLKDESTRAALKLVGLHRPSIDSALLETYTRHFFARGWLSRPPRRLESNVPSSRAGWNKG
jgi:amino acid adenylation domain-containing protein/thioester reductase-like protein